MTEIPATYSCTNGDWGPWHALVEGPQTGRDRWGPTRDRSKDKTLCGIQLTEMWERSSIEPGSIECQRCRSMMKERGMLDEHSKLLPKEIRDEIPPLYGNEDVDDPIVVCKFFTPDSNWTWFVLEGEEQEDGDWLFFGLVFGFEDELGYFTLSELEGAKGPHGMSIERDKRFKPKPLSEVWDRWPFK